MILKTFKSTFLSWISYLEHLTFKRQKAKHACINKQIGYLDCVILMYIVILLYVKSTISIYRLMLKLHKFIISQIINLEVKNWSHSINGRSLES